MPIFSSSATKSCGLDTDMDSEDFVEDEGDELIDHADNPASIIARIAI